MEQGPAILTLAFFGLVIGLPILAFVVRFVFFYVVIRMTPLEERTGLSPAVAALIGAIGFGYFNN